MGYRCADQDGGKTVLSLTASSTPSTRSLLSARERQLTGLIARGLVNKEIAYESGLTVGTVKEYLFHLYRKLGVHTRTELAIWALRHEAEWQRAPGS